MLITHFLYPVLNIKSRYASWFHQHFDFFSIFFVYMSSYILQRLRRQVFQLLLNKIISEMLLLVTFNQFSVYIQPRKINLVTHVIKKMNLPNHYLDNATIPSDDIIPSITKFVFQCKYSRYFHKTLPPILQMLHENCSEYFPT